jgi:hypothetical protein
MQRNASYSGTGPPQSYVNSTLRLIDTVQPQAGQYEWTLSSSNYNYSTNPTTNNAGGYLQIWKYGDSPSWGATIEATEQKTGLNGSQIVTCEFDLFGSGGDKTQSKKVAIDVFCGANTNLAGWTPIQPYAAVAIRSEGSNQVNGGSAILIDPNNNGAVSGNTWDNAIQMYPGASISWGIGTGNYIKFNPNTNNFEFYKANVLVHSI